MDTFIRYTLICTALPCFRNSIFPAYGQNGIRISLYFDRISDSLLISFQSSRVNGELRAFSNLLLRTSKLTGALQTCCEDITNNQGDLLQKR